MSGLTSFKGTFCPIEDFAQPYGAQLGDGSPVSCNIELIVMPIAVGPQVDTNTCPIQRLGFRHID